MDYKKSFFTLLGAILLYSFYSFVELQKSASTTFSKPVQVRENATVQDRPIAKVTPPAEAAIKRESSEAHHRKNLAAFEKEFTKTYYSDGKIVEYRKKMRRQAQTDERNLENEFSKTDDN